MRIFSKALVLFWAAILMVSSTCFGADIHYCKGEAQSFSVFSVAKPCKMHKKKAEKTVPKCCMAKKVVEQKPTRGFPILKNGKCCYNDQVSFQTDGEQQQSSIKASSITPLKVPQVYSLDVASIGAFNERDVHAYRGPPDPYFITDFQIFFQVFRI